MCIVSHVHGTPLQLRRIVSNVHCTPCCTDAFYHMCTISHVLLAAQAHTTLHNTLCCTRAQYCTHSLLHRYIVSSRPGLRPFLDSAAECGREVDTPRYAGSARGAPEVQPDQAMAPPNLELPRVHAVMRDWHRTAAEADFWVAHQMEVGRRVGRVCVLNGGA